MIEPAAAVRAGAGLQEASTPLCSLYDVALLDLDGVVYIGPDAVPGAVKALSHAARAGMRSGFVTNNASRPPEVVADHLRRIGVPADASDVVTSAQAAATETAALVEKGAPVLVVGGEGLVVALQERGLRPVHSAAEDPAAVVQGFSPQLSWSILREGALALARDLPWIVSNTDLTVNVPGGIAPANGSFVEVLRLTTGRRPDVVAGKPHLPLHRESMRRTAAERPLVVGDRLDTDIEGAVRGGVDSLLVFTGVTTVREAVLAPPHQRPTYLAAGLGGLLTGHPSVTADAGGAFRCGGWAAGMSEGRLQLSGSGERLDGVRAACAAAWAFVDRHRAAPRDVSALSEFGG